MDFEKSSPQLEAGEEKIDKIMVAEKILFPTMIGTAVVGTVVVLKGQIVVVVEALHRLPYKADIVVVVVVVEVLHRVSYNHRVSYKVDIVVVVVVVVEALHRVSYKVEAVHMVAANKEVH